VHQLEARLIGDDVPDDERDRELLLQRAEVYRGVLGGDVTGGRDRGLDDEYIRARLLSDLGEALGALGDRRDDGGPPALLDGPERARCHRTRTRPSPSARARPTSPSALLPLGQPPGSLPPIPVYRDRPHALTLYFV